MKCSVMNLIEESMSLYDLILSMLPINTLLVHLGFRQNVVCDTLLFATLIYSVYVWILEDLCWNISLTYLQF